jgi:hypothetical protein
MEDEKCLLTYGSGQCVANYLLDEFNETPVASEDSIQESQPRGTDSLPVVLYGRQFHHQVPPVVLLQFASPEVQGAVEAVEQERIGIKVCRRHRDTFLGRGEVYHRLQVALRLAAFRKLSESFSAF